MWSVWFVFVTVVFILSALWWIRIRGLWKLPDGRNWLRGKLGLVLMLSKSLIQFSLDGQGCVSSLLFDLSPNYGRGNEDNANSFKRSQACISGLSAPDPEAGHHQPTPPPYNPGHPWASLGQSRVWSLLFFPVSWCAQGLFVPQEPKSLVLCKFRQLCDGVNGDLLQEGLWHTQVCCTQSPCPCGRQLLTHASTGDIQKRFWLSHWGVSGSWCTRGLFEPSMRLWRVWSLILNVILSFQPSYWGFSFALGHGLSFFGGTQHSPFDNCPAMSCNFGVLAGKDELISYYSTILLPPLRNIFWETHNSKRHTYHNVHFSTVYNSQDMEAT